MEASYEQRLQETRKNLVSGCVRLLQTAIDRAQQQRDQTSKALIYFYGN